MKKEMIKVNVTQEDIDNGKRNNFYCCPIALAVRRALGVGRATVCYNISVYGKMYSHTKVTKKFVNDFDEGKPVEPFEFELIQQ